MAHNKRKPEPGVVVQLGDRQPPNSPEAEQGVLGCCLLDPARCVPQCVEVFGKAIKSVMYDLRHQLILDTLVDMQAAGKQVDMITVMQQLKDDTRLEEVGGLAYLSTLPDVVPSAANLSYYTAIVLDKHMLRRLVHTCTEVVGRVYDYEGEVAKLLDEVEASMLAVRTVQRKSQQQTMHGLVTGVINDLNDKWDRGGGIGGLPTGFIDLDKVVDGLHPGEITIVAAFPSVGKTALAMNIAEHVALDLQQPVGVFSLEMPAKLLVHRMLGSRARVNMRKMQSRDINQGEVEKLTKAVGLLAKAPLFIEDESALSIMELRAKARRMQQEHGIKLYVIDYLQLLSGEGDNREQEVASISRGCKHLAGELGVPVLVLSQLNDEGKLRESRAIGQNGDNVWLLERDEQRSSQDATTDFITLWVKKQRNGERNVSVQLNFFKQFTRFETAARVEERDMPQ